MSDVSGGLMKHLGRDLPAIKVLLPPRSEGQVLTARYINDIQPFYQILHTPYLCSILDNLYSHLHEPDQIPLGDLVLIVSVFAAVVYYWPFLDDFNEAMLSPQLSRGTRFWIDTARMLIGHFTGLNFTSTTFVQALVILSSVVGSLEGPTLEYRSLFNQAVCMAQDMRFHIIDHACTDHTRDQVHTEIQRRVWWYLASTDW